MSDSGSASPSAPVSQSVPVSESASATEPGPKGGQRSRGRFVVALIAAGGLLLGGLASYLSLSGGPQDPRSQLAEATVLFGQERPLPAFALTAHDGSVFDLNSLTHRWTLLFFGYTYCPDVCPITLGALNSMLAQLPDAKHRERLQVVFVSVDPKRDTLERLSQYVPFFNPDFLGVRGDDAQLQKLTQALGAVYLRGEPKADGSYTVDHSNRLLLIGPDARFTAVLSDRTAPPVMAADLTTIFEAYGS